MNKYRNKPQEWQGQKFRSKKELLRYQYLSLMQQSGGVQNLRREVVYELAPAVIVQGRKRPPLRYLADFVYTIEWGREVVEDCKGMRTQVYNIKRHLMKSIHGIEILET